MCQIFAARGLLLPQQLKIVHYKLYTRCMHIYKVAVGLFVVLVVRGPVAARATAATSWQGQNYA